MGFNTFPCNPYPISTDELNKGNNDELNTRVTALESDVSDLNNQKANLITIAPNFSTEVAYSAGDLVYHNGTLYKFTADHAAGEWSAEDTQAATVSGEVDSLKSSKAAKADIALDFSAEAEYEVGDLVYYNGSPYRCTNAHEGAWDAADFSATTVANELSTLMSGLTSRLLRSQTSITAADFLTFVAGVFGVADGLIGDNSDILINAEWAGQNNYTFIVHKTNSNTLYAIIWCVPAMYQADYIGGVTTSRPVQFVS